jgi:cob(I)alamin adenosyltransferase
VATLLTDVQHDLFDLGGELSIPGHTAITPAHGERLEAAVEHYNADLPMLKEFILPGGTRQAALAHVARTVCRRAERTLVALAAHAPVSMAGRIYLNRLSDLLFVLARVLNRAGGAPDVLWQKDRARGSEGAHRCNEAVDERRRRASCTGGSQRAARRAARTGSAR